MGAARVRAVVAAARRHALRDDRRRAGTAAVGDPARALPADVRARVRRARARAGRRAGRRRSPPRCRCSRSSPRSARTVRCGRSRRRTWRPSPSSSLVCHQALADRRPSRRASRSSTSGSPSAGSLGGVFNALVAPVAVRHARGVPARDGARRPWRGRARRARRGAPRGAVGPRRPSARLGAARRRARRRPRGSAWLWYVAAPLVAGALMFPARSRCAPRCRPSLRARAHDGARRAGRAPRVRGCGAGGGAFALGVARAARRRDARPARDARADALLRARSFFGAYTVRATGTYHHLQHGTTLHGAQDTRVAVPPHAAHVLPRATDRSARCSPRAVARRATRPRRVGVVGLGTGTMACYGRAGRAVDVLRDRPAHRAHRARPAVVHVPPRLPAARRRRRRRRARAARRRAARRRTTCSCSTRSAPTRSRRTC